MEFLIKENFYLKPQTLNTQCQTQQCLMHPIISFASLGRTRFPVKTLIIAIVARASEDMHLSSEKRMS